jgi:hypothetical protein
MKPELNIEREKDKILNDIIKVHGVNIGNNY